MPKKIRGEESLEVNEADIHTDVINLINTKVTKSLSLLLGKCYTKLEIADMQEHTDKMATIYRKGLLSDCAKILGVMNKFKADTAKKIHTESIKSDNIHSKIIASQLFGASRGMFHELTCVTLKIGKTIISALDGIKELAVGLFNAKEAHIDDLYVNYIHGTTEADNLVAIKIASKCVKSKDIIATDKVVSDIVRCNEASINKIDSQHICSETISAKNLSCNSLNNIKASVLKQVFDIPNKSNGILTVVDGGIQTDDRLLAHAKLSGNDKDCHPQYASKGSVDTALYGLVEVRNEVTKLSQFQIPSYRSQTIMLMAVKNQDRHLGYIGNTLYDTAHGKVRVIGGGLPTAVVNIKLEAGKKTLIPTGDINTKSAMITVKNKSNGYRVINDCVLECNNKLEVTVKETSMYHITIIGV